MIELRLSPESVGAVHTHTHTHGYSIKTNVCEKWSKGGSREQLEVSRLPRDLIE